MIPFWEETIELPLEIQKRKKLIAVGFDMIDNTVLADHIDEMERQPFDGTVMMIRHDEARTGKLENVFEDEVWQPSWFREVVDQITAVEFSRFTDNFLRLMAVTSSEIDWFDDVGWANIVEHWRLAAWTARQSGLKGIAFDPEGYKTDRWRDFAQFSYLVQPQRDRYSFAEYYDWARQRGREVLEAIVAEYPEITLFCFFMNSVLKRTAGYANPQLASRALLEYSAYTLYPAFINGWLDVAPPMVTFVDGCENAYLFNSQQEYLKADLDVRKTCQELVATENRDKYKTQVQVGFGVYLDAYWNPSSSS
jgi:hypothetical protein